MDSSVKDQGIFGQITSASAVLQRIIDRIFWKSNIHIGFYQAGTLQMMKKHGKLCPNDFCRKWGIMMSEGYELRDWLLRNNFIERVDPVNHALSAADDQFRLTEKGEQIEAPDDAWL